MILIQTQAKFIKNMGPHACQICGDNVGKTVEGEVFVACNVCKFPVCRPCYEYERKDGNQSCPQCKSRYQRQKGLFGHVTMLLFHYVIFFVFSPR